MTAAVRFFEFRNRQMKVTLGGGEAAVAQDLLNVPEVGLALQKMCGSTVPPKMTGDTFLDPVITDDNG